MISIVETALLSTGILDPSFANVMTQMDWQDTELLSPKFLNNLDEPKNNFFHTAFIFPKTGCSWEELENANSGENSIFSIGSQDVPESKTMELVKCKKCEKLLCMDAIDAHYTKFCVDNPNLIPRVALKTTEHGTNTEKLQLESPLHVKSEHTSKSNSPTINPMSPSSEDLFTTCCVALFDGTPCSQDIFSCTTHSFAERRKVPGRMRKFDTLAKNEGRKRGMEPKEFLDLYRKDSDKKAAAKKRKSPEPNEPNSEDNESKPKPVILQQLAEIVSAPVPAVKKERASKKEQRKSLELNPQLMNMYASNQFKYPNQATSLSIINPNQMNSPMITSNGMIPNMPMQNQYITPNYSTQQLQINRPMNSTTMSPRPMVHSLPVNYSPMQRALPSNSPPSYSINAQPSYSPMTHSSPPYSPMTRPLAAVGTTGTIAAYPSPSFTSISGKGGKAQTTQQQLPANNAYLYNEYQKQQIMMQQMHLQNQTLQANATQPVQNANPVNPSGKRLSCGNIPNMAINNMNGNGQNANLTANYQQYAQMQNAQMQNAQMQKAQMQNVQMQGTQMQNNQMQNVNSQMQNVQMQNAQNSQMQNVQLQNGQMQNAQFQNAQMQNMQIQNNLVPGSPSLTSNKAPAIQFSTNYFTPQQLQQLQAQQQAQLQAHVAQAQAQQQAQLGANAYAALPAMKNAIPGQQQLAPQQLQQQPNAQQQQFSVQQQQVFQQQQLMALANYYNQQRMMPYSQGQQGGANVAGFTPQQQYAMTQYLQMYNIQQQQLKNQQLTATANANAGVTSNSTSGAGVSLLGVGMVNNNAQGITSQTVLAQTIQSGQLQNQAPLQNSQNASRQSITELGPVTTSTMPIQEFSSVNTAVTVTDTSNTDANVATENTNVTVNSSTSVPPV